MDYSDARYCAGRIPGMIHRTSGCRWIPGDRRLLDQGCSIDPDRSFDLECRVDGGRPLFLDELDEVTRIIADEDIGSMRHFAHPDDIGTTAPQFLCKGPHVLDGERHVLVAMGVYVSIRGTPLLRQRFGAGHVEELHMERAVPEHSDFGGNTRDGEAPLQLKSEHVAIPANGGLEIWDADAAMVMPEFQGLVHGGSPCEVAQRFREAREAARHCHRGSRRTVRSTRPRSRLSARGCH